MTKLDMILKSPQAPGWMVEAARHCLVRDPIGAANEAKFLADAMQERASIALKN